jgi:hypothetical protein
MEQFKKKKRNILTSIGMIPWVFLMVLYFIWANQNGFSISKNAHGIILMFSGIVWYSIIATFVDGMTE